MRKDIIDFHAHPYLHQENNYCHYKQSYPLRADDAKARLESMGIVTVCGSVLSKAGVWDDVVKLNDRALELRESWGDFYVPGFHIHPDYVEQSVSELRRMADRGVKLVGELVPYMHGWAMDHPGLVPILEKAQEYGMVISYHSTSVPEEVMDGLLDRFPDTIFVAAHPGEKTTLDVHLNLMNRHKNYYLDLSGGGIGRMGMLRYAIDRAGKERFLFGTDYPICPPEIYIAALEHDPLLTQEERQAVFADNAKRILNIR